MGCCKPDREGLRVLQLLVVLAYRSLVKLGCDFAPLERRVFRSSRATGFFAPLERQVFSLLSSDRFFAPLERRVFRSSRATGFSLLSSEMFIARQPINIPLRRSGMCYARTSRRSATRRLGISFSRQTRLRFRSSRATGFSLLSSDVSFAPLERQVFRSSRATCLSLLSSDGF